MSEILNVGGGASASPIVKAVLDAIGESYVVEIGMVDNPRDANSPILFRRWSNGFIEQGSSEEVFNTTITFPIEFSDTKYALIGQGFLITDVARQSLNKVTTGFQVGSDVHTCASNGWYAFGY